MTDTNKICDRINAALTLRQMSGPDLARKSGINKGTLWRYRTGQVIPKQKAIEKMSRALNVSPAWLLGFDLTPEGKPLVNVDLARLTDSNRELLLAYYKALIDSQEAHGGKS